MAGILDELNEELKRESQPAAPSSGKVSVLDELAQEIAAEKKPSVLQEIEAEIDKDPESLRKRKAAGQPLSVEQERLLWEANRARPLGEQVGTFLSGLPAAVVEGAAPIVKGAWTFGKEMAPAVMQTLEAVGSNAGPEAENKALLEEGNIDLLNRPTVKNADGSVSTVKSMSFGMDGQEILVPTIADDGTVLSEAEAIEQYRKTGKHLGKFSTPEAATAYAEKLHNDQAAEVLRKENNDRAVRALRHIPIGAVNAGEDIAGIVAKGAYGGSGVTDRFKELPKPLQFAVNPLGSLISGPQQSKDKSFSNFQLRQDFDRARQADIEANPDRAATGMARFAESTGTELGKDTATELRGMALQDVDQNMVAFWDFLAPGVGEEQLLRLTDKPMKAVLNKTGKGLQNVALGTTVAGRRMGVAPATEAIGGGMVSLNSAIDRKARQLSKLISGDEDALFRHIADPLKPFLWVPGKGMQTSGRVLNDLGRQIDEAGTAGRKGLAQRAGESAASGDFTKQLFSGPGGKLRAQAVDAASTGAGYVIGRGTQGGIVQTLLGLGNIEDVETASQIAGTGIGIGLTSAALPSNMVDAARQQRIVNEDADIQRARAEADPELAASLDKAAAPATWAEHYREEAKKTAAQIQETYSRPNTEDERAKLIEKKLKDEATAARLALVDPKGPEAENAKRQAWLGYTDVATMAKPILRKAGLGDLQIKLVTPETVPAFVNSIYAAELSQAQAVLSDPNATPQEKTAAQSAIDTVAQEAATLAGQRGALYSEKQMVQANKARPGYVSPIKGSIAVINMGAKDNLLRYPGNFEASLRHEVAHAIDEFSQAQGLRSQIAPDFFTNYYTDEVTGEKIPINEGVYGDAEADADAAEYLSHFDAEGQAMLKAGSFADAEKRRAYMRGERFAEAIGLSTPQGSLLRSLNSPVQTAIDWAATVNLNGALKAARDAVVESGWVPGLQAADSTVLAQQFSPQTLAAIRNFQRAQMAYDGNMAYYAEGRPDIEVPILKVIKSPALQRKFQDLDLFEMAVTAEVFNSAGKKVAEISILDPAFNKGGEYVFRNGRFEAEDGSTTILPPEVASAVAAMPGETKVNIASRISRNPDGTPKLLSEKERESRSKDRGLAIRKAIDSAPDIANFPNALKDTGNGSYRGVMTPGQLAAIDALPETLVPRVLKRKIFMFNDALSRGDGTRFLIEYQAALKGGKYRALSPRIRDVIPIGFQFSKQGNFLATTASVSRMFDKLNYYSGKMPEMLAPWAGDQTKFMQSLSDYLQNHAAGRKGEDGLDIDLDRALEKKNILNDFLNMFDASTEAANPIRTKIKAKRGQDSPDRVIMSARMDRINAIEESSADKLPINYGLVKRNYMPSSDKDIQKQLRRLARPDANRGWIMPDGETIAGDMEHSDMVLRAYKKFGLSQEEAREARKDSRRGWENDDESADIGIKDFAFEFGALRTVVEDGVLKVELSRGARPTQLTAAQQALLKAAAEPDSPFSRVEFMEGLYDNPAGPSLIQQARAFPIGGGAPQFMPSSDQYGFYSKLETAVAGSQQKVFSADQAKALARKATNPEELKWTGIEQAIDEIAAANGGKVSRDALLQHLNTEGKMVFEETRLANASQAELARMWNESRQGDEDPWDELTTQDQADFAGQMRGGWQLDGVTTGTTRNSRYTTPGGTNHREIVLRVPGADDYYVAWRKWAAEKGRTDLESEADFQQETGRKPNDSKYPFSSGDRTHYSDLKALGWVRINDRQDSEGRLGLFIDEIQSKLHQEGREKGYADPEKQNELQQQLAKLNQAADALEQKYRTAKHEYEQIQNIGMPFRLEGEALEAAQKKYDAAFDHYQDLQQQFIDAKEAAKAVHKELQAVRSGIPDAPFRKSWPLQLFKRALREAVATGKDWIGWTTGETQAERYDLSKQVKSITSFQNEDGSYDFSVVGNGNQLVLKEEGITLSRIEEVAGKEIAEKVKNREGSDLPGKYGRTVKELKGLDLKIGGEGMKGFYDVMLPKEIGKYVKQWGGKVEKSGISNNVRRDWGGVDRDNPVSQNAMGAWDNIAGGRNFDTEEDALRDFRQRVKNLEPETITTPIWRVNITPEMRESVRQGQPRFMPATKLSKEDAELVDDFVQGGFDFFDQKSTKRLQEFASQPLEKPTTLYRISHQEKLAEGLKPGALVDISDKHKVASFTELDLTTDSANRDRLVEAITMEGETIQPNDKPVIYRVNRATRGLKVPYEQLDEYTQASWGNQREHLLTGKFVVTGIGETENGETLVDLRQAYGDGEAVPVHFMPSGKYDAETAEQNRKVLAERFENFKPQTDFKKLYWGWQRPSDGKFIRVEHHHNFFRTDEGEILGDPVEIGYVRLVRDGQKMWYNGRPNRVQKSALQDAAIESKLELERDGWTSGSRRFMPSSSNPKTALGSLSAPELIGTKARQTKSLQAVPVPNQTRGQNGPERPLSGVRMMPGESANPLKTGNALARDTAKAQGIPLVHERARRALQVAPHDAPEWAAWFNRSQLLDDAGRPLLFQHRGKWRAPKQEVLDPKLGADEVGAELNRGFGPDKIYFSSGRKSRFLASDSGYPLYRGYIRMQKPFDGRAYAAAMWEAIGTAKRVGKKRWKAISRDLDEQLKAKGYDGIFDPVSGDAAIFEANQFKSANNSTPTTDRRMQFMPASKNSRYTKQDGSFDVEAWKADQESAAKALNRRGSFKAMYSDDEWKQLLKDQMRTLKR